MVGQPRSIAACPDLLFYLYSFQDLFEATQPAINHFWVQNFLEVFLGIRDALHRVWQRCTAGIGMASALELFGYRERFTVLAAQADAHGPKTNGQRG